MRFTNIQSCQLGPEISPEQFIPEHFFLFLIKGSMKAYDGHKSYEMVPGDFCIARKNHLIRYTKIQDEGAFEKIIITFDMDFLERFLDRHPISVHSTDIPDSFLRIKPNKLIDNFILSLEPYYTGDQEINPTYSDIKREELLLILLENDPNLGHILFNFGIPEKIDLEAFMLRNFRFNVSLERFAFLTGRSLSTFKRDFMDIFGSNPGIWLKNKRLDEAYFQLRNQKQMTSQVYVDVGFENLSHFSAVFKEKFGLSPSEVAKQS